MNKRLLILFFLLATFCIPALGGEPAAGTSTYRVTMVLYPGDDPPALAKRLAAMYRGMLETPVDGKGGFLITVPQSAAALMSRDPIVAAMEPASDAIAMPAAAPSAPAALSTAAARPVESTATTSWSSGTYEYDASGNVKKIGTDFYAYDTRGRIRVSANAAGTSQITQKQSYTYDDFGNLRSITTPTGGQTTLNISGTSNRLSSVSNGSASAAAGYDSGGNFTSYNGATYTYDALDVMRKSVVQGVSRFYVYNASDERIGTIEQDAAGTRSEWTIRDNGGQVLRRYAKDTNGNWSWQEDYIYRGSLMLAAEVPDPGKIRHFHLDHLGTPRLITGNGGAEISRHNYHPFGEEIAPTQSAREKKQFTGHERDAESLDYMHARFYAPFMGRFLSVDPAYDLGRVMLKPQGWNRYSYVENNPI
ncbi:MAG TPA: RHS repeat-associated core domain-containing protein, partial [Thermoanaerobaculia bacterium]|nr:RHS repeat-associated core domain-containing protein [Thermoanaerobaculia bacterium]